MLLLNENVETPGLKSAAESICVAARTTPKGKAARLEPLLNLLTWVALEVRMLNWRKPNAIRSLCTKGMQPEVLLLYLYASVVTIELFLSNSLFPENT
jgi:hypothetical protein